MGRPHAAIECLYCQYHKTKSFNAGQAVKALIDALSIEEAFGGLHRHYMVDLISALQKDESVREEDMVSIEWGYLRLLEHENDVAPRLLMSKLATEPEFFCEVIRLIYKSRDDEEEIEVPDRAEEKEADEAKQRIAENAWHLLYGWNRPPGLGPDNKFDGDVFSDWLSRVQQISKETGHYEVAMINVGEVVYYTPEDPGGFWINRVVAKSLDARGAEEMRSGFRTQIYNARGAHWVDPTGAPERELANMWRDKADAAEQEGFARLAATLRSVASGYDDEAERIVRDHADRD